MRQLIAARLVLGFIAAGLTAACAGGGGGGGAFAPSTPSFFPPPAPGAPPSPPSTDYPDPNSAEYQANWGVGNTGALTAWQRGYTGEGVAIGVIDDGVDPTHPELQGRISPDSTDINTTRAALTTTLSHGSELSSLIAGNFNNQQTVGAAFGATILAVRADNGAGAFFENDLAAALNYAVSHGVDIVNFSLGSTAPSSQTFTNAVRAATAAGVIVVVSAGNEGASAPNVNYPGYYATDTSISHGLIVVAGGLNENGTANGQSNRPGAVASWYLMAPGWGIVVPDFGPSGPVPNFQQCGASAGLASDLCEIQGTSYASPHVAAALALLKEASPSLTPQQLVDLLLNSARDAGAAGTDAIYGRGILDIARAFQPIGPLMLATPQGGETLAMDFIGTTGGAFGDALSGDDTVTLTAFDNYGRSFNVSLGDRFLPALGRDLANEQAPSLWRRSDPDDPIRARFVTPEETPPQAVLSRLREAPEAAFQAETELSDGTRIAFASHTSALDQSATQPADATAHLGFAGTDLAVAVTRSIGDGQLSFVSQSGAAPLGALFGESARVASAVRYEEAFGPANVALTFGGVREKGAVLGATWAAPWGDAPDGATTFAGMSVSWSPAKLLQAALSGEVGRTRIDGGEWMTLASPLMTTAFSGALRLSTAPTFLAERGMGGAWTLSVAQPLRVERGAFNALLPQSDAWGRAHLAFAPQTISAVPSGREIEARLGYWLWQSDSFVARAEFAHRTEPGHVADAEPAQEVLIGVRLRN